MTIPQTQKEASEKALRMKRDAPPASIIERDKCCIDDAPTNQNEATKRAYALKRGPLRVLISDKDVAEMIGGSRATVWRRVGDGVLPRPIKFGGMTRWILAEVEAAIARQIAARDAEAT
jgi:predicted DNA-binding transcriptional regulator AlpA